MTLTDILDHYMGISENNLHRIFQKARNHAPCVLFLDEIDALGIKRSLTRNSGMRSVVNQLLEELDGIGNDNDGVYILAATNTPWDIDPALRRPGRLDRTLLVDTAPHPEQNLCLITWEGRAPDPRTWQDVPTIFERLERDPDRPRPRGEPGAPLAVTIGPARFAGSGLTVAGLRGAPHLGADCLEVRPQLAVEALRRGIPLVYLYVGELDRTGHAHGWRSVQWLEQLERLDAAMAGLVRRVPAGTRIILTADHGMVDTGPDRRVDISASPALARDVVAVAGEPRFTHLYVPGSDQDVASEVARRWRDELGERAMWIGTRAEAGRHLGPVGQRAAGVLGDVLVAMSQEWVAVDPRVHSESAIAMPGVHGSLTRAETAIPLLTTLT